ncbi:hypothetical protein EVAR_38406_1 [Eumeta japonica]|uniref:Histone-lysine N-methyltransferase SETMAR n=1 Tax=Eumeta variegata TaxID=151549 RepID=A0A4C1X0D6_EUMVA|nr:hypothetical protein EVAR_38406_1 [Eumeta japonica]
MPPPHSPDLAPSDCPLFHSLQNCLGRVRPPSKLGRPFLRRPENAAGRRWRVLTYSVLKRISETHAAAANDRRLRAPSIC